MIHHIQAYSKTKHYGRALNQAISYYPDNCWLIIRDFDTMPFDGYHEILEQAIKDNPDCRFFTCWTNRAYGLPMDRETNILNHWRNAQGRKKRYTELKGVVPAFFWMIHKSLWTERPFDDHPIIWHGKSFDARWTKHMDEKKIRIDHLYIFHFYRLNKSHGDYGHLK